MPLPGFYWLVERSLAGSSRPGGESGWPRAQSSGVNPTQLLEDDCHTLVQEGIGAILTLTEEPLQPGPLTRNGLVALHLPILDQTAPLPADFTRAIDFIDEQLSLSRAVLVHCRFGMGRTGTILAAWLIKRGETAEQAIARLREVRPGSVTTEAQEAALYRFASRREWIV